MARPPQNIAIIGVMPNISPAQFKVSIHQSAPPDGCGLAVQALWWDGKGDWQRAHEIAQTDPSSAGSWVHAYLHRKEGDEWNAAYWYRRAKQPVFAGSLDDEWQHIATNLL